jgi:predicted transcriptional regulator
MAKTLTIRIEHEDRKQLEKLAQVQERSVGFLVRKAVKEFLKRETNGR